MRGRRLLAIALLAAFAVMAAGPATLAEACQDDCPPECGDCAGCIPPADSAAVIVPQPSATCTALAARPLPRLPSFSPHQPDHVPLRTVA
jgi:hypothetical protein